MTPEVKNLYTAGSGIFDTHVTWEDIEHDMQKVLNTKAVFGDKKTVKNIGDGNGYMSRICLVEPDWQNAESSEKLPAKFIAKLSTGMTIMAFAQKASEDKGMENFFAAEHMCKAFEKQVKMFHNSEVRVYSLLDKYNNEVIPRPTVYFSRPFTDENPIKGYLLMEYKENLTTLHIDSTVKPEMMHEPLKALASLYALSLQLSEEELSVFSRHPIGEIFGAFFTPEMQEKIKELLGMFEDPKLNELAAKLVPSMDEIAKDLKFYDNIPDTLGARRVICHGDLWSANILWRKENDELKIAAIIDYQTAHLGSPAGDLSRLFNCSLSAKDRKKHTDDLIDLFYGYLEEEVGKSQPMPFTLDQLKENYKRFMPIAGYIIIPMFGSIFEQRLKNVSEDEKQKLLAIVQEKMEGLIEDMLECHKRNKELGLL